MRSLLSLLLVTLWIGCGPANRDSSDTKDAPPMVDACLGLRCRVKSCAEQGRPETSISGTVFAPNGKLPLFGVTVYVPNTDPGFLTDGAQCSRCVNSLPGDPIAQTLSDSMGHFRLTGVPSGEDIPLIITIGKWRKQLKLAVPECTETQLVAAQTSLPKSKTEGEMPRIAIATGGCDALECLARKIGIADSEFTSDAADGRVHLFTGTGGAINTISGYSFAPAPSLWGSLDKLKQYDLAMFSCECSQYANTKPQAAMDALKAYADLGGRVFLSHYHSVWISGEAGNPTHAPAVWPTIASCNSNLSPSTTGVIDQVHNPRGMSFASWMANVGGSSGAGEFPISDARGSCSTLDDAKAERWVNTSNNIIQNFQFTTPNEIAKEDRCGKVVFSDMHVASGSTSGSGTPFPGGCSSGDLTSQEKALAFMFFDIASCVGPIF
jgi:hypothetical protein